MRVNDAGLLQLLYAAHLSLMDIAATWASQLGSCGCPAGDQSCMTQCMHVIQLQLARGEVSAIAVG
jgi:hypothetical protein